MTTERYFTGSALEPIIGYCRALRTDDRILVSGTGPVWPDGSIDPDPAAQTRRSLEMIIEAIEALGGSAKDVVRTRLFLTNVEDGMVTAKVHGEIFGDIRPTTTAVVVSALLNPAWRIEIEAEALVTKESTQ